MKSNKSAISLGRTGFFAGLLTSLFLIIYFLLMRILDLTGNPLAWGVNFIILLLGINYCYLYYRRKTEPNIDYLPGMQLGSEVAAVSVVIYTLFIYFYFLSINPQSLANLNGNLLFMSEQATPLRAAFATFIEGISSGIVVSFILMQYYRSGFDNIASDADSKG